ncbi:MAG: N-acetylmuramoyl-L-alanine amidase [Agathobaculum sp.]|uniref:N-acetylmuramoyl-L-alanine amidase n=1 Tax=Agathobaculum sp. TaxID=2048138 RepID=UPI002A80912B|nr:N-acetylmuramoyl-L-alanine amidase [Agathobaculum sp.]MDY3712489.1 N-acetylmuramoyl-L-alanine amidase [Agathobaculum sp.]
MMKILLIAGHGGTPYDPGAVANGYTEAVETRRMALAVMMWLRAHGFEVDIYDQHKDAYKVVREGGSLPLDGVDYALEFHLNAAAKDFAGDGRTTGTEIWIHTSEKSDGVEQAILRRMTALGFRNRGVKRSGGFAVQRHCIRRGVSHALIETCFVDDKDDMTLYKAKFDDIARAIADGVAEGFGKMVMETEEDETMTMEQFQAMYDKVNPLYTAVDNVPDYWQAELRELMQCGAIKGDGRHEIAIRREELQAAVVAYRAVVAVSR